MDPSSTPEFLRTFTLWANNLRYDIDGPTFAKMSKKCGRMMQQGQTQGILVQRVRDETLEAFKAASQLKPFKITHSNAFELLDIATEWEVSTLVKFATDYIKQKDLKRPENVDPVGDLIEHSNNKEYNESDIISVSNIINDALTDERFMYAPPESIFRVLLKAEQRSIDQVKLLDFVITLFNMKPSSAVPLLPLIDFSRLTKEQDEGIFLCQELHEENIGFFLSWALSSTRNKSDRERIQADERHYNEMETMKEVIEKAQNSAVEKMKLEHDNKSRELLETAKRQEAEIRELEQTITEEAKVFKSEEKVRKVQMDKIEELIDKMKKYAENLAQTEEEVKKVLQKEVSGPIDVYHNEFNQIMNEVGDKNDDGLNKIEKDIVQPTEKAKDETTDMLQHADEIKESLVLGGERLYGSKAAIAVKIVRDNLRFDKYIRQHKEKLDLFNLKDGKGLWGVKQEDATKAYQQMTELEKRIEELCPLDECD